MPLIDEIALARTCVARALLAILAALLGMLVPAAIVVSTLQASATVGDSYNYDGSFQVSRGMHGVANTSTLVGRDRSMSTLAAWGQARPAATGVAAEAADDWPVLSGIVRDASKGKGNSGLGSGTASQATRAGESWVGDGYRIASDGKTFVSRDGLRTFRPPTWKPNEGKYQANFEYWIGERVGKPFGNGHLDIMEMGP